MILFLTSDPIDRPFGLDRSSPAPMRRQNGFADHIKTYIPRNSRALYISGMPDSDDINPLAADLYRNAMQLSGISLEGMDLCDRSHPSFDIADYACIILGGGHVPTQNQFFQEIGLRATLQDYLGVVIGVSAGTMNCAQTVYAQPELAGEAIDPDYARFIPGLGLTTVNVLPHWQTVQHETLDGLRLKEDISIPDSIGRSFYCLVDGSYLLQTGASRTLYGEAYMIQDGAIRQISKDGDAIPLP